MSEGTFRTWEAGASENVVSDAQVHLVKAVSGRLAVDVQAIAIGDLSLLKMATAQQNLCRYSLDVDRFIVAFPVSFTDCQVWQGTTLKRGELIVLGPSGGIYQRMEGPGAWGWMTMPPTFLKHWCGILTGNDRSNPMAGGILRPERSVYDRFATIHQDVLSVSSTRPEILANPEARRAIEQDLTHALIRCITATGTVIESDSIARLRRRQSALMQAFDDYLETCPEQSHSVAEIGEMLDVSERTLRIVCGRFAGMSPRTYSSFRRMNAARTALRNAPSAAGSVAAFAEIFGFRSAGRFSARYRQLFGEYPFATLRGDSRNITQRQPMAENE